MTRSLTMFEMTTRVSTDFLADANNNRWSIGQVTRFINDAQADFARGSKICRKFSNALTAVSPTTPTDAFYALPQDFIELEPGGVWDDTSGTTVKLRPMDPGQLPNQWDTMTSAPPIYRYIMLPEFGATQPAGFPAQTQMRVWPAPTSTLTGLKVFYAYLPDDLQESAGDYTPIPTQFHMALVYYSAAMCLSMARQEADLERAKDLMGAYERELAAASALVASRVAQDSVYVECPHL